MNGLHIISNFYNCKFNFKEENQLVGLATKFCTDSGLTVVGVKSHEFEGQGITFTILLAESHLSLHSWPEHGNVAFDIYTCNFFNSNNDKTHFVYQKMKETLQPEREDTKFIDRESLKSVQ